MFEVLFQYGSVTIKTFNIILAITFLLTGAFIIRYISKKKLNLAFLSHYFLHIFLSMLIIGRIFYVFENWSIFKSAPIYTLYIWDLHFSFFGLLIGFALSAYLLTRKTDYDFWGWFDTGALSMIFAMIFVNIGHFFNGTQYGSPTDLPWGISFDTQNIPFVNPIHPTQLYASILALVITIIAVKRSKRVHLSGVVGSLGLMLYSLGMLGIDFLHGAPSLYFKISFGITAAISFILLMQCSHKKLNLPSQD